MLIMFRIESDTGIWSTLGQLQKVNKDMKDYFIKYINNILAIKSDEYKQINIKRIAISFGIRKGEIDTPTEFVPIKDRQNYKHYKLPITMDPLKYGKLIYLVKANSIFVVQLGQLTQAIIKTFKNENQVEIMRDGNLVLTYKDKKIDSNQFERFIGKNRYLFVRDGDEYKLSLLTVKKTGKNITQLKCEKPIKNYKIATMDFETFKDKEGKMTPYLVSWFDGIVSNSYFLNDFNNHEEMLETAIKDLLRKKYSGFKIYLHNFAKFDCIFLLDTLTKLGKCKPIVNNGRFISVGLTYKTESNIKYQIDFRDSLQLLLMSLSKLAKSFGVDVQKGIFPHKFVTSENLDYIGAVPEFKYFEGISLNEYLNYCLNIKNNWSLRMEAIKYCNSDCISLYQILIKFNELIFDRFKININKYPTLPSLSFAIYRTLFLKKSYFITQKLKVQEYKG
jgi:DNA polymerase type B, organellar and viral